MKKQSTKNKYYTVKKIATIIEIIFILILTVFVSIGVSSITNDYNYFIFTVGGIIICSFALIISYLIILAKRKMNKFREHDII
jgi:membrane protein YdbS with pleckstrin-like domain